jgi:hypothetical protein
MLINLFYELYFDANFDEICKLEPAVEVQFSKQGSGSFSGCRLQKLFRGEAGTILPSLMGENMVRTDGFQQPWDPFSE